MSKKDKKQGQPAPEAGNPAAAFGPVPGGVQPAPAAVPDASKTHFFIFWGLIAVAAAAAWILAVVLPGVSESIIERWLMGALAASLAVLLLIYK
ncbi:MAG: hypothetical protein WCW52_09090 [Elusimicrobiales bacterium]|jgi:hypothetical protein